MVTYVYMYKFGKLPVGQMAQYGHATCFWEHMFPTSFTLLLADCVLSRDYFVKIWSSENQYLTASQSKGG